MDTHLGKVILAKLKEKGISKSEFARQINKSRQNVQDIFKRKSLDTELLIEICIALDFNFFELLSPSKAGEELRLAQKEIEYLKKIIELMEKK